MNSQRITVSLPHTLYEDLLMLYGKGKISRFVAEAVEQKVLEKKLEPKDPISAFFAHKKTMPKLTRTQIMSAIHKGRM